MPDAIVHARLGTEIVVARYALPPGAIHAVEAGAIVSAGDVLATMPAAPVLVAFADTLRQSVAASAGAIHQLHGTATVSGARLGQHRAALRVRTLTSPTTGDIEGLPESGALIIRPADDEGAIRARNGGVVTGADTDAVAVASRAHPLRYAFRTGPMWQTARLMRASSPRQSTAAESDETFAVLVPYVEKIEEVASIGRQTGGLLLIGAVSESVAAAMLTAESAAQARGGSIIVLFGPGNAALGEHVVAPLTPFAGCHLMHDRRTNRIVIATDDAPVGAVDEGEVWERGCEARSTTPAHWSRPCIVTGRAQVARLETGLRTLTVPTRSATDGNVLTPVINLVQSGD